MSATVSRSLSTVGIERKTASAWVAANARPRFDAPAWYSTGVRCGDGSDRWMPGTLK